MLAAAATHAVGTRQEEDSLGIVRVPSARLWGAQTQRSLDLFRISVERMPEPVLLALAQIKQAAARVNRDLGLMPLPTANAIAAAADEVIAGHHRVEFPLSLWQTGSGTQSNMNMNEVLANRASELLGGGRGAARDVDPNDDVNRGQSSNDVFASAMNMAALVEITGRLNPAVQKLAAALHEKAVEFAGITKLGRTHLQDATPLTLGQEFSGWVSQLQHALEHLAATLPHVSELAIGGTAVGTGLNTHPDFGARVAAQLSEVLGVSVTSSPNKFEAVSSHDALVFAHGAVKTLAAALWKISNDVRWLASGPRSGLGELRIPANEPGSSIMPGKVNPTQCEALIMCCMQVMANDVAVGLAGGSGNFQLNVCRPLLIHCFLQSVALLSDAMDGFREHLVVGIEPDRQQIARHLDASLMLVTAISPHIGYAAAAQIAKRAQNDGLSLREAALQTGLITAEQFEQWVKPEAMLAPGS